MGRILDYVIEREEEKRVNKMFNWLKRYTKDYDTQREAVLAHLERGKTLTQLEATKNYSILRLSAIIHKLRNEHEIKTLYRKCKKRGTYAEYKYISVKKGV